LAASTPYLGAILLVIVLAWLGAARSLDAQFTPLVQKDLKVKLLEGKLSAISAAVLGQSKARKEVISFSLSVFVKVTMFRVVHCHQAHEL
jgi:AAA family ATP:ADP antiporter